MKEKWINNWGLKLIAVLLAVLIWLLIMNNTDPVTTFTISGIPIEFVNEQVLEENDMVYQVTGSKTVSVEVTTRTQDKRKITAADFKATADLNNIYDVTSNVKIKVELIGDEEGDKELVRGWHQIDYNVKIETEDIISKAFTVEVVQEGQVQDGYDYRQCTLSSNTVILTGTQSKLNNISAIKAIVDVSQSAESETMTVPLTFYNRNGREIQNLADMDIKAEMLEVNVDVMVQKTSPVSLDVLVINKDKVAEGYRYITYRISQQSISVIGTMQAVAGLDKIQIEADAEGISGETVMKVDIQDYLPSNVTVAGEETEITISLIVEPEGTIELEVPSSNVRFDGQNYSWQYLVHQPWITVNVFGLKSDWKDLTAEDITLIADVSGRELGDHILTLTAEEIEGLVITVPMEINLTVAEEPEETTEADDESEPSTETGKTEESTEASAQVGKTEPDETQSSGSSGTASGGRSRGR